MLRCIFFTQGCKKLQSRRILVTNHSTLIPYLKVAVFLWILLKQSPATHYILAFFMHLLFIVLMMCALKFTRGVSQECSQMEENQMIITITVHFAAASVILFRKEWNETPNDAWKSLWSFSSNQQTHSQFRMTDCLESNLIVLNIWIRFNFNTCFLTAEKNLMAKLFSGSFWVLAAGMTELYCTEAKIVIWHDLPRSANVRLNWCLGSQPAAWLSR